MAKWWKGPPAPSKKIELDPARNTGRVSFSVRDLTEKEREKYPHATCPGCSAEVYPSGYTERDKCDVCFSSVSIGVKLKEEPGLKYVSNWSGTYSGNYNSSMSAFSSQRRAATDYVDDRKIHLLSEVVMPVGYDADTASNLKRHSAQHKTGQTRGVTSTGDEYLSGVSEAHAADIVQEVELVTRAIESHVALPAKARKEIVSTVKGLTRSEKIREAEINLRLLVENTMAQLGPAIGHKIGDDWYMRDTIDEARKKQDKAGSSRQPAYSAGLYGEEVEVPEGEERVRSFLSAGNNKKIADAISAHNLGPALDKACTTIAKAPEKDRIKTMFDELLPIITKIVEQNGGTCDGEKASDSLDEALKGKGQSETWSKQTDYRATYQEKMQDYMNGVAKEIIDERQRKDERKKAKAKWTEAGKKIAKAYGLSANGVDKYDGYNPLLEQVSQAPKPVKISWSAGQMLEAVKDDRRISVSEKGEATDKMVELNFGNLKVFRQEEVYHPQLLIGVDTSGSTGCICNAGQEGSGSYGDLMWETASALSQAGTAQNTTLYGYGSTGQATLTVTKVPNGHRVQCYDETNAEIRRTKVHRAYEHGGGTPEYAMLHFLNEKAQEIAETTVILIVDGAPDMPTGCGEMAKEMVKAGVRFGVVVVGRGSDYYSSSVSVKINSKNDIERALPKLLSLIAARGIS